MVEGAKKKPKSFPLQKFGVCASLASCYGAQAVVLCQMNLKGISTMLQYHIKYNSKVQL